MTELTTALVVPKLIEDQPWGKSGQEVLGGLSCKRSFLGTLLYYAGQALERESFDHEVVWIRRIFFDTSRAVGDAVLNLRNLWKDINGEDISTDQKRVKFLRAYYDKLLETSNFIGTVRVLFGREMWARKREGLPLRRRDVIPGRIKMPGTRAESAIGYTLAAAEIIHSEDSEKEAAYHYLEGVVNREMDQEVKNTILFLMIHIIRPGVAEKLALDSLGLNLRYLDELKAAWGSEGAKFIELARATIQGRIANTANEAISGGIEKVVKILNEEVFVDFPFLCLLATENRSDPGGKYESFELELMELLSTQIRAPESSADFTYILAATLAEVSTSADVKIQFAKMHVELLSPGTNEVFESQSRVSRDTLYMGHLLLLRDPNLAQVAGKMFVEEFMGSDMIGKGYAVAQVVIDTMKHLVVGNCVAVDDSSYYARAVELGMIDTENGRVAHSRKFLARYLAGAFKEAAGVTINKAPRNLTQAMQLVAQMVEKKVIVQGFAGYATTEYVGREFLYLCQSIRSLYAERVIYDKRIDIQTLLRNIHQINIIFAQVLNLDYIKISGSTDWFTKVQQYVRTDALIEE